VNQHTHPLVVTDGRAAQLRRIDLARSEYDEAWLQKLVFENPSSLPIEDIEPVYSDGVAICRELVTPSGSSDVILLNPSGYPTIVECKLWRNPEARRKVVAQIIDYAKDISKWDYAQFESACLRSRKDKRSSSLVDIVRERFPDVDEAEFIDSVQRNLRNARFLLAIVGDGIRESASELIEFLNLHGSSHFTLTLVELPLYQIGDTGQVLVTPRVLVKTTEIVRTVVSADSTQSARTGVATGDERPSTATVSEFYRRFEKNRGHEELASLEACVETLSDQFGIVPKPGRGKKLSLNLKSADESFNFMSIQETGEVWYYGVIGNAEGAGDRQIGLSYLQKMAELVGGEVDKSTSEWSWSVRKSGDYLTIDEYLEHSSELIDLIGDTLKSINEAAS
jgi:hypothetical protein